MTSPKFQAGVGPSQTVCHLYALPEKSPRLSLCEQTVIARNYKGALSIANARLCRRCFKLAEELLEPGAALNAETIGVSEIVD